MNSVGAGSKGRARDVVERWASAFNAGDIETLLRLYRDDATVHGTLSPGLARGEAALRAYFEAALSGGLSVALGEGEVATVGPGVAASVGFYDFPLAGRRETLCARYSFVLVEEAGGWRIAHHHSSVLPGAE